MVYITVMGQDLMYILIYLNNLISWLSFVPFCFSFKIILPHYTIFYNAYNPLDSKFAMSFLNIISFNPFCFFSQFTSPD